MDYPWRGERNAWLALAAEVLLQRTRAGQVVPVYEVMRERYPGPEFVADAPMAEIDRLFNPLGLHWRANYFKRMGTYLRDQGAVPTSLPGLLAVPSVGTYAAAAFLSLHKGKRATIVDANVVRWLGRLFGFVADGETRRKSWLIELAEALTPTRSVRNYNYAVLDLTMAVCTPRPRCDVCPLRSLPCTYAMERAR